MEGLPAGGYIALDALTFLFITNVALDVELGEVELAPEIFEFCVFFFEPDISYPVDTSNVHPLLSLQVDHSTLYVRTQHATGYSFKFGLDQKLAP